MVRLVGNCTSSVEKGNIRKPGNRRERNVIWRCGGFVMGSRGEGGHARPGVGGGDEGVVGKVKMITKMGGAQFRVLGAGAM